jgi:hypothetical protein
MNAGGKDDWTSLLGHQREGRQSLSTFFPFPISHFPFPISHFPFPISHFPFPISHFPSRLNSGRKSGLSEGVFVFAKGEVVVLDCWQTFETVWHNANNSFMFGSLKFTRQIDGKNEYIYLLGPLHFCLRLVRQTVQFIPKTEKLWQPAKRPPKLLQ